MTVLAALLTLSVAAGTAFAAHSTCQNSVLCPCGSTGKNITVCIQTESKENEVCRKFSRCKSCQDGLDRCLQCENGYEGFLCSIPTRQKVKSRQKRQYRVRRPQRPGNGATGNGRTNSQGYCPNLDRPKLGSISCVSNDQGRTCVGRCLPGHSFEGYDAEEITLVCYSGAWAPFTAFPPCESRGQCDLIAQGPSSFNCTTEMSGTRCDVRCSGRFVGRFYCYPGQPWEPDLPYCVRPKEVSEQHQACRCESGGSCDSTGNCVCPAGRTGTSCEIIVPDKTTCSDPGFISNGFRRQTDGSQSTRRTFDEEESVVYGCTSEQFALQGSSLLTCKHDGTWSSPLPKCIQSRRVTAEVMCRDPGQVANAERLNSDGSASAGVQQYRVGQSVVYTCHPGFALQHRSLITCLAAGAWSDRTPVCRRVTPIPVIVTTTTTRRPAASLRFCRDPGVDSNGSRQPRSPPSTRGFPQGSQIEFSCNQGYDLSGERSIFCLTSGAWSASRPRCEPQSSSPDTSVGGLVSCLNPGSISNGQIVYYPNIDGRRGAVSKLDSLDPEYPEGSRIQYTCNSGYTLEGTAMLSCENSGLWSTDIPVCRIEERIRYCQSPGSISNGRGVRPSEPDPVEEDDVEEEYPEGDRLQYSCDRGYRLVGAATLTCLPSGQWSAAIPKCETNHTANMMFCSNPGEILNGRVSYFAPGSNPRSAPKRISEDELQYPEGTQLQYGCEDGYTLQGSPTLRCQSTGFWSANPPTCGGDCGRSTKQTSRRVLFGTKTFSGEWPWVVAIATVDNNTTRLICGGAVLNSRTIVTAAHCLIVARRFRLYFGKLYRRDKDDDSEVLVRRSSRVIIHPDFTNITLDSDIGLVMFEPRIRYSDRVQPICLPTAESTAKNLMTGKRGYVTGWGLTEKNLQSDELLLASLPVLTNQACLESYRKQNITLPITGNMFCAGYEKADQSACSGDSGSPLVFYDSNSERYTIEGVVSFGVEGQCGLPGRYSVFTKVFQFLPWIFRNLQ